MVPIETTRTVLNGFWSECRARRLRRKVRSDIEDEVKKATLLRFDEVFGLDIAEWRPQVVEIPEQIIALATEREQARQDKNWQQADELRDEIEKSGYSVEDTSEGPKLSK